jgi:hypothetical protein
MSVEAESAKLLQSLRMNAVMLPEGRPAVA